MNVPTKKKNFFIPFSCEQMVKQLKSSIVNEIISLTATGLSGREVAKRLGISQSCVSRTLKRTANTREISKKGRPRLLDRADEKYICRMASTGKASTAREITQNLRDYSSIVVSQNTVLRCLRRNQIRSTFKKKKPLLNRTNKGQRRNFEKKYRNSPTSIWDSVIWSDETKICLISPDGRDRTFRKAGEPDKSSATT